MPLTAHILMSRLLINSPERGLGQQFRMISHGISAFASAQRTQLYDDQGFALDVRQVLST